jgi:copper chaperone CopZ
VCAHAVRVSLKSLSGVDTVDVSLEKGLATVKMKTGNAVTFRQLQDAITKNGFTMKPSNVSVVGKIVAMDGHLQLQVSGSNELVNLIPERSQTANFSAMSGKLALVEGTLEEGAKGKVPDTIGYRTVTEEK